MFSLLHCSPYGLKNEITRVLFKHMQDSLINNGDNKVHHERKAVIGMDHCTCPNLCEDSWWIEELQLLNSNKITAGGWLSAPVINSGQFILAKQLSPSFKGSGFQDVGYGLVMNFYIEKERFYMILLAIG